MKSKGKFNSPFLLQSLFGLCLFFVLFKSESVYSFDRLKNIFSHNHNLFSALAKTEVAGESSAELKNATINPQGQTDVIGLPARIKINRLNIDAPVEALGLTKSGDMAAPENATGVGWYKFGPRPGDPGSAVMAGHLDTTSDKAVFWNLKDLNAGDTISVSDESGKIKIFKVVDKKVYDTFNAPLEEVFGPSSAPHLNLITCAGKWLEDKHSYSQRLVVFAEAVQ
jgi:sortase A